MIAFIKVNKIGKQEEVCRRMNNLGIKSRAGNSVYVESYYYRINIRIKNDLPCVTYGEALEHAELGEVSFDQLWDVGFLNRINLPES